MEISAERVRFIRDTMELSMQDAKRYVERDVAMVALHQATTVEDLKPIIEFLISRL